MFSYYTGFSEKIKETTSYVIHSSLWKKANKSESSNSLSIFLLQTDTWTVILWYESNLEILYTSCLSEKHISLKLLQSSWMYPWVFTFLISGLLLVESTETTFLLFECFHVHGFLTFIKKYNIHHYKSHLVDKLLLVEDILQMKRPLTW